MPGVIGGVYFLVFLAAILLVVWWCKTSEQGPAGQETKGLFAMKNDVKKFSKSRRMPQYPPNERP
jgi:hypothetical protein